MKKSVIIASLLMLLVGGVIYAASCPGYETSLVQCGQNPTCPCEISDIFTMILRVYNFILWNIATPLAALLIVIGGALIMISGGPGGKNPVTGVITPNLYNRGRDMVLWAVVSTFLIFGAWLIINTILAAIGYIGV